jgi:hypothetical protein
MKTYDFIIVLKRTSYTLVDRVSQLMISLAVVFFILYGVLRINQLHAISNRSIFFFANAAMITLWLVFCKRQSASGRIANYRFALMLAAWGWFLFPKVAWLSCIYLLAAVFEKPVKREPEIAFDKDEILLNSIPKKRFLWSELNNVILKDGILTIDKKNDKIFQGEVNEEVPADVEIEFNNFCKANLQVHN